MKLKLTLISALLLLALTLNIVVEATRKTITIEVRSLTLYAPAVSETPRGYKGVMTKLHIKVVYPGSGETYLSTTTLISLDMQASIRLAARIASELAGKNFHNYDFYVKVEAKSPIVGGPSAGALITVGFLALLLNDTGSIKFNYTQVTMTGTINPDGSIGPVGGVFEKCKAAYEMGFKVFIIPYSEELIFYYNTTKTVKKGPLGITIITRTRPIMLNITEYARRKWGIRVVKALNVLQAFQYFTGIRLKHEVKGKLQAPSSYIKLMSNAYTTLSHKVEEILDSISGKLNSAARKYVTKAEEVLDEAKRAYSKHTYYVASCLAFRSYILVLTATYIGEVLKHGSIKIVVDESKELAKELDELEGEVRKEGVKVNSLERLEVYVGCLTRLGEAKSTLNEVKKALEKPPMFISLDYVRSLCEKLAYIKARIETVRVWLKTISKLKSGNLTLNRMPLDNITQEYVYLAESTYIYLDNLIKGIQIPLVTEYYNKARKSLIEAREYYDQGKNILALAKVVETLTYTQTALDLLTLLTARSKEQLKEALKTLTMLSIMLLENVEKSLIELSSEKLELLMAYCYYEYAKYSFSKAKSAATIDDKITYLSVTIELAHRASIYAKIMSSIRKLKPKIIIQKIKGELEGKQKITPKTKPTTRKKAKTITLMENMLSVIQRYMVYIVVACLITIAIIVGAISAKRSRREKEKA